MDTVLYLFLRFLPIRPWLGKLSANHTIAPEALHVPFTIRKNQMQHGGDQVERMLEPIQYRIKESREEGVHLAWCSVASESALWA